jgi:hypothetical protein
LRPRIATVFVPFALSTGCLGANDARSISEFHEVSRFRPSDIHSLYPSVTHFVVAPESVMGDRNVVLSYSRRTCADRDQQVCFVLFWTDASKAAKGFPISASEADAMVASYNRNRSSGQDGFQCYNFGEPRQRCAAR